MRSLQPTAEPARGGDELTTGGSDDERPGALRNADAGAAGWDAGGRGRSRRQRLSGHSADAERDDSAGGDEPQVLDARLLPAAVCCWAATIVGVSAGWVAGLVLAASLTVLAIGLWILLLWSMAHPGERRRAVAVVALASVLLAAGFAVAAAWREHRVATHPLRAAEGYSLRIVATPGGDPKPVRGKGLGGSRWVVRGALDEYRSGETTVRAGGAVVILASGDEWGELVPGQAVEFRARVELPGRRDLTVATLLAQGSPRIVGTLPWWQRVAHSVRTDFATATANVLPAEPAGLLPALVDGDTSALPDELREEFEIAGLSHLCVVSGANFSILLGAVLVAVRVLTLGPRTGAALAAAALVLFVIIARPDPSVLRAGAMGAITLLALVTGRQKQALPALCAAIIGLLAVWPALAVSVGFALSVCATAGLILLAPSWADWLRARGWRRVPAEIVAVAAGAFVVTTPLMVALDGKLSLVAVLANVLVEPVIAPITVVGAIGAVASCVWLPLAELVVRCAAPPMWWLLFVAEHVADLPGSSVEVPAGPLGGLLALVVVALVVLVLRVAAIRRVLLTVTVAVAAVVLPARIWHPGWPPDGWVVAACDVGQGDGLALSVGQGTAVVIDVGPDPRPIRNCLNRLHISRIPLLVLTHPHADHIGGLTGALDGRGVGVVAVGVHELEALDANGRAPSATRDVPAAGVRTPPLQAAGQLLSPSDHQHLNHGRRNAHAEGLARVVTVTEEADIPLLELSAGQSFQFGTTELKVLAPTTDGPRPIPGAETEDANDRSIVLAATTPLGRILLTGDIESPAQQTLLESTPSLQSDILKLPHHGSRTTTKEFLEAVHPRLTLISVGTDNTFGHPSPDILTQLSTLGSTIIRTDRQGDVLVLGDKQSLRVVTGR